MTDESQITPDGNKHCPLCGYPPVLTIPDDWDCVAYSCGSGASRHCPLTVVQMTRAQWNTRASLKPQNTPEAFLDPYAAQRGMYLGRLDMARGVIRHMENEITQVQAMLDRLPKVGGQYDR